MLWLLISCIIHNDNSCKGMSHNHLLVEINILILWKASALNRFKRQHICWQLTHFSGQLVLHFVHIYTEEQSISHRFFSVRERESIWKLVIYPWLIYLWGVDVRFLLWDYLLCLFKLHYPSVLFSIHIVQSHLSWMLFTVKSALLLWRSKKINNGINTGILVVYLPTLQR